MPKSIKYSIIKNNISFIAQLGISVIAYVYIINKIIENYEFIKFDSWKQEWGLIDNLFLSLCLILMLFNWLIESYKWKIIISCVEKISFVVSIKCVLFGLTSAIFTPYRIGEYIGRPMMISEKNRVSAIMATFVGSLSQSATTLLMGLLGLFLFYNQSLNQTNIIFQYKYFIDIALVFSCILILVFYYNPKIILSISNKIWFLKKWLTKITFILQYKRSNLFYFQVLSQSRYIIFFIQYFLLLKIFNVNIYIIQAFIAISLSYLFLFSIPGLPIAEVGIRGSLAIYFIGFFSNNDLGIFAASTSLWIINLAAPSFIGSFFIFPRKIKTIPVIK